jgi:endonuclease/exonuclease/phosphatase family metal-dependent hydrolase
MRGCNREHLTPSREEAFDLGQGTLSLFLMKYATRADGCYMRLATFNLESLDLPPKASVPLEVRAEVLRPALDQLHADILCLQEVNGQHIAGSGERRLMALDQLLAGTRYADYARAVTTGRGGRGVADVHNLVTLSRFPIRAHREVRHVLVPPPRYHLQTASPCPTGAQEVRFERPVLVTEVELPGGEACTIINLHLRAPLAAAVAGQKLQPFVWRSVGGWAEGYFLAAIQRTGQALEVRLYLEQLFDVEPHRLIAVAGDFNAEDGEVPMRILIGAEENTGNAELSGRSLVVLDRTVAQDRRWSVLHHGRAQMLDHIAVSRRLYGRFITAEVHNETLSDELVGYGRHMHISSSYHAAVVAEFADLDSDSSSRIDKLGCTALRS